jgi:hypothetical protein
MPAARRRTVCVALAAVALGAACRGDDDAAVAPPSSGPASTRATTAAPDRPADGATTTSTGAAGTTGPLAGTTATSSAAPGPSTTPVSECATIAPLPPAAGALSSYSGDVDADGAADEITVYAATASPSEGDWHLRVDFGAGGGSDVTLRDNPAPGSMRVLGSAYLGPEADPGPGGRRPALFVWTGSGASARTIGLFRVDGCELSSMTLEGGPASFVVGASVGHQEGLRCEAVGEAVVIVEVLSEPDPTGSSHTVTRRAFTRSGHELVPHGELERTASETPPPEAGQILGCGDVSG